MIPCSKEVWSSSVVALPGALLSTPCTPRTAALGIVTDPYLRTSASDVYAAGDGAAQNVDFMSLAIQMGATQKDLLSNQYATHPELVAKPSDNTYVFATRDAMANVTVV